MTPDILPRRPAARAWSRVGAWAAVILAATSVPLPLGPSAVDLPLDKAAHFGLYAGLGWLTGRALRASERWGRGGRLLGCVGAALFAAGDELHQHLIPGRQPGLGDWAADVAGFAAGLAALWAVAGRGGARAWASAAGRGERGESADDGSGHDAAQRPPGDADAPPGPEAGGGNGGGGPAYASPDAPGETAAGRDGP